MALALKSLGRSKVVTFPTSRLSIISLPPGVVPTVRKYPVALLIAFQVKLVSRATPVSPFIGLDNVVHSGVVSV